MRFSSGCAGGLRCGSQKEHKEKENGESDRIPHELPHRFDPALVNTQSKAEFGSLRGGQLFNCGRLCGLHDGAQVQKTKEKIGVRLAFPALWAFPPFRLFR